MTVHSTHGTYLWETSGMEVAGILGEGGGLDALNACLEVDKMKIK